MCCNNDKKQKHIKIIIGLLKKACPEKVEEILVFIRTYLDE